MRRWVLGVAVMTAIGASGCGKADLESRGERQCAEAEAAAKRNPNTLGVPCLRSVEGR